MSLPRALLEPVTAALRELGDSSDIRTAQSLGGGCINNAMRLDSARRSYLLKWNSDPLPGMFTAEAEGLKLLAETGTVRVPAVYAVCEANQNPPAFILLEWLQGNSTANPEKLAQQLAELHRKGVSPHNPPAYGLGKNNYLGSSVQYNAWESDWPTFFAEYRLHPQMEMAQRNGRLPNARRKKLENVIANLPRLLGSHPTRPSLIHGDLWGGNVIPGPDGLALIDPAVSYSDREAEIAFTELFGGFSDRFYAAYQSVWPLDPGYAERRDLYNLYHLLNHLNLFGESYGYQVDKVLNYYAG